MLISEKKVLKMSKREFKKLYSEYRHNMSKLRKAVMNGDRDSIRFYYPRFKEYCNKLAEINFFE